MLFSDQKFVFGGVNGREAVEKAERQYVTGYVDRIRTIRDLSTRSETSTVIHTRDGETIVDRDDESPLSTDITQIVVTYLDGVLEYGLIVLLDNRESAKIEQIGKTLNLSIHADKICVWINGRFQRIPSQINRTPLELSIDTRGGALNKLDQIASLYT